MFSLLTLITFLKHMKQNKITWSVTERKVSDLIKNGYNPRKLSQSEREDLEKSVTQFGTVVPVVLNTGSRKNIIIGGEQRIKIYADLGIEKIDCMVPSRELTTLEEQELNLRLNKNTGSWDTELLKIMDMDMLLDVGFGDEELQSLFDDVEVVDDEFNLEKAIKETIEPKVKTGQVWKLGEHKLLVGDSTDSEMVGLLMENEKAHLVLCDSPYNIGISYNSGVTGGQNYGGSYSKKDDSKTDANFKEFLKKSMTVAKAYSTPSTHFFYWADSQYIGMIQDLYKDLKVQYRRLCLWIKNNANITNKIAFNKMHEVCLYGTIGKPYLNTSINNYGEILNQEIGTGNQAHEDILDMIDLWLIKRDNVQDYLHPTQKPVTLSERPLRRCSAPGHIIFSGFGGSGSDLIACEQLHRKWRGVEIDLIFATIIIDRWEKFTNLKAELIYEHTT
jgi:DNA modification methylase